ncbi:hypothetical protein ACWKWP_15820 [Agromyces soli]
MADGLWWLPSLLVFSAAGAVLVIAVLAARRLGRRRELADLDASRAIEVRAKGLIVETDERLRDARAEVAYAEAQFGVEASAPLRDAVARAEQRLREAFVLQQRLDDAEPDTAAERRSWSGRIAELCTSAIAGLEAAEQALGARRSAERGAGATLAELADAAARLGRRRADASAALDRLATRYPATALVGGRAALERVDAALAIAAAAIGGGSRAPERPDGASGAASPGATAPASGTAGPGDAERVSRAQAALERATSDLDGLDRIESELADAERAATDGAASLEAELSAARRERDALADADAAGRLARVIGELSAASAGIPDRARGIPDRARGEGGREPVDPFARLDQVRAARDRLEAARAEARTSQSRLDGARAALGGAIAIAESQIGVARSLIERGRGAVGATARTRLAEAERQLVVARQEPDPVAALDAARRATARAADAEALAMWDAGQR